MAKNKKRVFKLNPEWMLKDPLDFEYNKYTLLDYLQKCERNFNNLELYPDFVELSLHLANIQSLSKEKTLLLTEKKFESCDDEILLKELIAKKPRELSKQEEYELDKTIRYSGNKLFDAFNLGKSIWNLAYDNLSVSVKKNKKNICNGLGYFYFFKKDEDKLMVWEYEIKKPKNDKDNNKTYIKLIYENPKNEHTIHQIIENFSSFSKMDNFKQFPIFEVKSDKPLPIEETLVPIVKRKIMVMFNQNFSYENTNNFDN